MVSDAGGFDDKSFNQAGFEGLTQAEERARHRGRQRRVRRRHRLHAEHRQPGRRELRPDHRRRLPPRGPDPDGRRGQPGRQLRARRQLVLRRRLRARHPGQRQADPLRHGAGRLPRRLRRRGDVDDRQGRHLRRHPDPVRHDLHGRLRRRHRQVQRGQRRLACSCSAGTRPRSRASSPATSTARTTARTSASPSSTRARTSSCPSPVRSVWAPASVAQAAGNVAIIGVDADWFETTEYGPIILTSVMKEIGPAVFDTISEAVDGSFSSDAVRRHAGERGPRPGAVPRLRVEGPRRRRRPSSTSSRRRSSPVTSRWSPTPPRSDLTQDRRTTARAQRPGRRPVRHRPREGMDSV